MGVKKPRPAKPPEDRLEAKADKSQSWRTRATQGSEAGDTEDDEANLPAITKQRRVKIAEVVEEEVDQGEATVKVPYKDVPPIVKPAQEKRLNSNGNKSQDGYIPAPSEKAYRVRAPVQKDGLPEEVARKLLAGDNTFSPGEVLGISPEVREITKNQLTKTRVSLPRKVVRLVTTEPTLPYEDEEPTDPGYDALMIDQLPVVSSYYVTTEQEGDMPPGSAIGGDAYTQYLESLDETEKPRQIIVAGDSASLRVIYPVVNKRVVVECVTDSGSQIVSMSLAMAKELQLVWDPDIQIFMQSANGSLEKSIGLAKNVAFTLGDMTVYLQVHIINGPAYKILLGRPFEILTESTVQNYPDGSQTLTLKDPNSQRRVMVPTHSRGKASHGSGEKKASVESVLDEEDRTTADPRSETGFRQSSMN